MDHRKGALCVPAAALTKASRLCRVAARLTFRCDADPLPPLRACVVPAGPLSGHDRYPCAADLPAPPLSSQSGSIPAATASIIVFSTAATVLAPHGNESTLRLEGRRGPARSEDGRDVSALTPANGIDRVVACGGVQLSWGDAGVLRGQVDASHLASCAREVQSDPPAPCPSPPHRRRLRRPRRSAPV